MSIKRYQVIRWGNTWRVKLAGESRAKAVFRDCKWENSEKEAIKLALVLAINHCPADVIVHKQDASVKDWFEVRRK